MTTSNSRSHSSVLRRPVRPLPGAVVRSGCMGCESWGLVMGDQVQDPPLPSSSHMPFPPPLKQDLQTQPTQPTQPTQSGSSSPHWCSPTVCECESNIGQTLVKRLGAQTTHSQTLQHTHAHARPHIDSATARQPGEHSHPDQATNADPAHEFVARKSFLPDFLIILSIGTK